MYLEIILPGAEREINLPMGVPEFGSLEPRGELSHDSIALAPRVETDPSAHGPAILTDAPGSERDCA